MTSRDISLNAKQRLTVLNYQDINEYVREEIRERILLNINANESEIFFISYQTAREVISKIETEVKEVKHQIEQNTYIPFSFFNGTPKTVEELKQIGEKYVNYLYDIIKHLKFFLMMGVV